MNDLKIIYLPIEKIKNYKNNPKKHTEEQIKQIIQSIRNFGNNDPIAIYENGEIAEGHGRLEALKRLGYNKVPVIELKGLTKKQQKAYRIIHNQLTMNSDFDIDILNAELSSISDYDMAEYGFSLNLDNDYKDLFMDSEKEKKKKIITCPYCGEIIEI